MSKMVFELCYCKVHIIWPCLCADSSTLCMFCVTVIPKISLKLEHELRSFTGCWCSGPTAGPQACESCQCFVVVVIIIFVTLSFISPSRTVMISWLLPRRGAERKWILFIWMLSFQSLLCDTSVSAAVTSVTDETFLPLKTLCPHD